MPHPLDVNVKASHYQMKNTRCNIQITSIECAFNILANSLIPPPEKLNM